MQSSGLAPLCSRLLAIAAACLAAGALLTARREGAASTQPAIAVRSRAVLTVDGRQFKDANGNGTLDRYEDWRLPVPARVDDLVPRLTLEEKVGLMLIETLVGRPPPFVFPQSDYSGPRRSY